MDNLGTGVANDLLIFQKQAYEVETFPDDVQTLILYELWGFEQVELQTKKRKLRKQLVRIDEYYHPIYKLIQVMI